MKSTILSNSRNGFGFGVCGEIDKRKTDCSILYVSLFGNSLGLYATLL